MRSFEREYVENTGTHTLMDMPTHRVTKSGNALFPIMMPFYFFSNSRRTEQTNALEAKEEKHFKQEVKNRVTSYQKESSRKR